MGVTDDVEYGYKQIKCLETIWGEGFLSPGGVDEINLVLEGFNLKNKSLLDIGCGIGGAAFHIFENFGAKKILGVDVEAQEEQNRYVVKVLFNVASIAEPQKLETYFERV